MRPRRLFCLVLALLTLAIFAQVRHFEFTNYDDPDYVSENSRVQSGLSAEGFRWAFVESKSVFWIPVTWLSHLLDCQLFALDSGAHHLTSLLLHTVNVLLLLLLLHRLTGALWRSALVAACFALHPLNVEPVAWIAERKGLLSTLLLLLTLHAWNNFVKKPALSRHALALALFALGLLAKPMLVTLPLLLLVLDAWPMGRAREKRWPALLLEKLPFLLLALAMSLTTILFASQAEAWVSSEQISFVQRLLNIPLFIAAYLGKFVAPVNLSVFYPYAPSGSVLPAVASAILLAGVTWLAWRSRARHPWLLAGWLWFLVALLPVLRVLQVGAHGVADRYAYVPFIGLFIVLAWGGAAAVERWRPPAWLPALAAGAMLVSFASLSWLQAGVWRNSITLFSHALEVTPANPVAHINLGVALEQSGRVEDALVHYRDALRLDPTRAQAHHNLANILDTQGRFAEALPHFEEAIRLRPREARPHCSLGQALAGQGSYVGALAEFTTAARLVPHDPLPHFLAAGARLNQGETSAAIESFRAALRLDPRHAKSLNRLARVLAASPEAARRDGAEAVRLATRAVELTGGQQPAVLDTLAMALAEAGRFDEAVQTLQAAIDLLNQNGAADEAGKLEPRLRQFKNRQPWREVFSQPPPSAR